MAINFPDSPSLDQEFTVGDVVYTWEGDKWAAASVPLVAPSLTSASLVENNITSDRFKGETFALEAVAAEEGNPASSRDVKVAVTRGVVAEPESDDVDSVGTVGFTSGFQSNSGLNENGWWHVLWIGPPYNCYFAQGNGASAQNMATSPDGIHWTRIIGYRDGSPYSNTPSRVAYCPLDQRLYYLDRVKVSSSGYKPVTYAAEPGTFDFYYQYDNSMSGINANSSHHSWGDLYWDYGTSRWWASRTFSQNGHSANVMRGPTTANMQTGWTDLGSITGSELGYLQVHSDYSLTWAGNGVNQSGSPSAGHTKWWADPVNSTTSVNTGSGGYTPKGRWMKVGTVGWAAGVTQANNSGDANRIAYQLGTSMSTTMSYIDVVGNANIDGGAITSIDLYDSLWIEELGIGVICGWATTATRDKNGILLVTSNCTDWTAYWTNANGNNSQYLWRFMSWTSDRQELVLVASNGTDPAVRAGYSKTVFQSATFPLLGLVSGTGLENFVAGMAIRQDTGGATGQVVDVDVANAELTVQTSSGTWQTGEPVIGASDSFSSGYLQVQSDGVVTGVTPADPGWTRLNGLGPWSLTFPATFPDGQDPDVALPSGSGIEASVRAVSETNGFTAESIATTSEIIPTN